MTPNQPDSQIPTSRTDAENVRYGKAYTFIALAKIIDFARTLERETIRLTAELSLAQDENDAAQVRIQTLPSSTSFPRVVEWEKVKPVVKLLEDCEWASDDGDGAACCPMCQESRNLKKHATDCELFIAITTAKEWIGE